MKSTKNFVAVGSLISLLTLSVQSQAQLSYNVSADPGNNTGVFSFFDPQIFWTSGDIVLPTGTTIGTTPLEIDLSLSHDLTLNSSGHYSWFLNYDSSTPIAENNDLGSLYMVLLENGTPITSQVGFDAGLNGFGGPATQFGTGLNDMPPNLVFNGVDIFVSNSNPEILTDVQISLDAQPVPEPSTLGLLAVGAIALLVRSRRNLAA
jgi:hypothetical protein